ncbi:FeoB-associated Cys-rich membrane protein [Bacillus tuaregi]|uniref:FeoB-associated Cys-rich membrane protein n=1 Tax=Bacillus tuaregi TaxID=1816695 RepID=UPI0008F83750|nr:FeoB-associated Cys-rich membrane protein [Bacillus tuaregi]
MIASIIIGAAIFGYAAWALIRHLKHSKQGECSSCSAKSNCSTSCTSGLKTNIK